MKEQALNWAQNETMVVYFTIEKKECLWRFFIHAVSGIQTARRHFGIVLSFISCDLGAWKKNVSRIKIISVTK
jgi:hypothetical protein